MCYEIYFHIPTYSNKAHDHCVSINFIEPSWVILFCWLVGVVHDTWFLWIPVTSILCRRFKCEECNIERSISDPVFIRSLKEHPESITNTQLCSSQERLTNFPLQSFSPEITLCLISMTEVVTLVGPWFSSFPIYSYVSPHVQYEHTNLYMCLLFICSPSIAMSHIVVTMNACCLSSLYVLSWYSILNLVVPFIDWLNL